MDLRGEALVEAGCRLFNHPPSLQGIRLRLDPPDSCLHPQVTPAYHPAGVFRVRATSTESDRWTLLSDLQSYPLLTLFVLLIRRSVLCLIVAYRRFSSMAARHKAALPRLTRRPCTPGLPETVYHRQI